MVKDKEIFDVLKDWNPWWVDKNKLNLYVGIIRNSYKEIFNYVSQREILIFKGVRRSGKSTILYQIIDYLLNNGVKTEQILFVNLEDKKLSDVSLEDIYSSYRKNLNNNKKAYIFLDEVHRKEDWEFWIRKKYDLKTNDKFFVSGSCSYLLEKEYSTLLTGRNITFTIYPLSYKEFLEFSDLKLDYNKISKGLITTDLKYQLLNLLKDYFKTGGFPEVFLSPKINKKRLLGQYFDDILYKDVVDRYDLTSSKVKDLSLYFMNNISNKYSLRNVRSALNISYDTIKDYLSYFKESYLFFELDHFSYSFKEQKTLPAKIYSIDNGLRNAVSFKFTDDFGKLAENVVFLHLIKNGLDIFYWDNKHEVDFVVKNKDNSLIAINVTYISNISELNEREINGLLEFKEQFPKTKELIILTQDFEFEDKQIKYIPLWKWLLK